MDGHQQIWASKRGGFTTIAVEMKSTGEGCSWELMMPYFASLSDERLAGVSV